MRNNKTCDTWYTTSLYLPSFKLMVAIFEKYLIIVLYTYGIEDHLFPTFQLTSQTAAVIWLNEVLRSLDRGFLFHGYRNRPLKLWFLTMEDIYFIQPMHRCIQTHIHIHICLNMCYEHSITIMLYHLEQTFVLEG